jgi:WXG100 family type VII secretion target
MMATFTDVETNQIRQTAQSIQQNIANMRRIRNTLDSNVLSRLTTCWQGEARDSFFRQFASFNTSLRALIDEYEALNNSLQSAESIYQQANNQVIGQINKIQ